MVRKKHMVQRNTVISIAKGIAIILMVAGHAEGPELLTNFIYTFHMPLFFMAAGYFFSVKYLSDPWSFISKRIKSLYFPFLKWSILFLLLHNLWFHFGILNETFGNWTGGVTHPYTFKSAIHRLILMVTSMSGYDEFLAGAFWFFRGLLVASVAFLLLYKLLDSKTRLKPDACVAVICASIVGLIALRIGFNIKITTIPNGGWREMWGIVFFGLGVLYRRFESLIGDRYWLSGLCLIFLCFAAVNHFHGMNNSGAMQDIWTLPMTGTAGFILTHHISAIIDASGGWLRRGLVYIGNNTLYVFVFHILAFKPVSALKIWWYDLPWEQMGCHMVIHEMRPDSFWIIYTFAGVALPLLVLVAIRKIKSARAERDTSMEVSA